MSNETDRHEYAIKSLETQEKELKDRLTQVRKELKLLRSSRDIVSSIFDSPQVDSHED